MEVNAVEAAVASLLIGIPSLVFRWRVCKLAAEKRVGVRIRGLNPLAPNIEFGEMAMGSERSYTREISKPTGETDSGRAGS